MRLLLLEPTPFDLSQAERLGEVVCMFPVGLSHAAHESLFADLVLDKLAQIDYDSENDGLLVVGKVSKIAAFVQLTAQRYGAPQLFQWSKSKGRYYRC